MGSCRARSVYPATRLLGRLSPLSCQPVLCTFFRQKLTTALLESAEGREWPQKIFHDQSPRKNVADLGGGWTRNLLVSSWTTHPTEPPRPTRYNIHGFFPCTVKACSRLQGQAGWSKPSLYTSRFYNNHKFFPWTAKVQSRLQGHTGWTTPSLFISSQRFFPLNVKAHSRLQGHTCRLIRTFTIHWSADSITAKNFFPEQLMLGGDCKDM